MSDDGRDGPERLASIAAVLADPTRLRILLVLVEREATVGELVALLGVPQPRVSTHLGALARAGLVRFTPSGRSRRYAVDAARLEPVLTGLHLAVGAEPAAPDAGARREIELDTPLRRGRRCYDHVAGLAAVELLDALLERGWLARRPERSAREEYVLRPEGEAALEARGVDVAGARRARRLFAFGCPDWTEPRPHLGGALARAVAEALERDHVIARVPDRRLVALQRPVGDWLA